jgi:ribosomal-protein-alanine N-acetyltransferase
MSTRRTGRTSGQGFPLLQTARLWLRRIVPGDAQALYTIFGDDLVTQYYDLGTMTDVAEAETMIQRLSARYRHGQAIRWGIARKQDGVLIGTCGYHFQAAAFKAEIGYDLASAHWHQGYMSEALRTMLAYGFETLDLNRIEALVMLGNEASVTVLRRLGFREEGILREYAFVKDRFLDLRFFSLLRREAGPILHPPSPP